MIQRAGQIRMGGAWSASEGHWKRCKTHLLINGEVLAATTHFGWIFMIKSFILNSDLARPMIRLTGSGSPRSLAFTSPVIQDPLGGYARDCSRSLFS